MAISLGCFGIAITLLLYGLGLAGARSVYQFQPPAGGVTTFHRCWEQVRHGGYVPFRYTPAFDGNLKPTTSIRHG